MKFPGGFNIQQMMKQAQVMQEKMQKEMQKMQQDLMEQQKEYQELIRQEWTAGHADI